ncbi:hypothetical protein PLICRDRAFT_97169 [Plicaturopsis crispa FD-325 SS-3]|nr:hypothetical protein PLICRDRAFT_97169 [Plicaturopsis crispa FD-325 SS-3]
MIVSTHRAQPVSPPPPSSSRYYNHLAEEQELYPTTHKTPVSPPTSPPRGRAPSLSKTNPMTWLNRASSSSGKSTTYTVSKPIRISEPKMNNYMDIVSPLRSGTLGSGATIVRTPQEALATHVEDRTIQEEVGSRADVIEEYPEESQSLRELPSPPDSPPLPPLPLPTSTQLRRASQSTPNLALRESTSPPRPTRAPPPLPLDAPTLAPAPVPRRPSLKRGSPRNSDYYPPVPLLPNNIPSSPVQPPFEPILMSAIPNGATDPSKVIVTLETCTATLRTTMSTLTSRPSYLSTYLNTLMFPRRESDASVASNDSSFVPDSSFNSIFRNHLTSSGLLPMSPTNVHIFLDRPSAPYAHILTYLRSPLSTPEAPAVLPRAVQLTSSSSSRLEALLELRDEARYLDLEELYKLCTDEIRARQSVRVHSRGGSSASLNGSIRSAHTFRDRDSRAGQGDYVGRGDAAAAASTRSIVADEVGIMSPAMSPSRVGIKGSPLPASPPPGWL